MKGTRALLAIFAACIFLDYSNANFPEAMWSVDEAFGGGSDEMSNGPDTEVSTTPTPREQWPDAGDSGAGANSGGSDGFADSSGGSGMSEDERPVKASLVTDGSRGQGSLFSNPTNQKTVVGKGIYETAGFIDMSIDNFGHIVDGIPTDKISFSKEDYVYLNKGSLDGVRVGDTFMALHLSENEILHPVSEDLLGYKVVIDGVLQAIETNESVTKARITGAFRTIERGHVIMPFESPRIPTFDPDEPPADKSIRGYVVDGQVSKGGFSEGDIVYFDVSGSEGVEPGDLFDIIEDHKVIGKSGTMVEVLPKVIGQARIIGVRGAGSTAYILYSVSEVLPGAKVVYAVMREPGS